MSGSAVPISEVDLTGDFDPEAWDKKMAEVFNDEYYDQVRMPHKNPFGNETSFGNDLVMFGAHTHTRTRAHAHARAYTRTVARWTHIPHTPAHTLAGGRGVQAGRGVRGGGQCGGPDEGLRGRDGAAAEEQGQEGPADGAGVHG